MYEFKDAMDKVKFDEKFTDVVDNIKRDCQQLVDMSFADSVNKINQWIDTVVAGVDIRTGEVYVGGKK